MGAGGVCARAASVGEVVVGLGVGGETVGSAFVSVFDVVFKAPLRKKTPPAKPATTASPARIITGFFFDSGAIIALARGSSDATGAADERAGVAAAGPPDVPPLEDAPAGDIRSKPTFDGRGNSGEDEMSLDGGGATLSIWTFGSNWPALWRIVTARSTLRRERLGPNGMSASASSPTF